MSFNYSKLLGKIKECGLTQSEFALKIGTTKTTLSLKLSNKASFKQVEIKKSCDILGIPIDEIGHYFFNLIVQKS